MDIRFTHEVKDAYDTAISALESRIKQLEAELTELKGKALLKTASEEETH